MVEKVETPVTQNQQATVTPAAKPAEPKVPPQVVVKPPEPPKPAASTPGASPVPAQEDSMVPIKALHEEREKRQALQAEIEALKKVVGQNVLFDMEGKPVGYNQPIQTPQNNIQQELDKLWETDPRKAVQAEIYAAMSWRDNQEAAVDRQEASVANKYHDFDIYRSDVRQYIRTLPIEQRGNPGVVELAYYVVKGQKVDNIIAKTKEQLESEYRQKIASGEYAQPLPGGVMSQIPATQGVTLTDEQKRAADAMHVSYADYAKYVK